MKQKNRHIIICFALAVLSMLAFQACLDDSEVCCYNLRIEYRYTRDGALGGNEVSYYTPNMREYIFDSRNILVAINIFKIPLGTQEFFSEQKLPEGRYTVITFGNKNGYELINHEEIGRTTKDELLMAINHAQTSPEVSQVVSRVNALRANQDGLPETTEIQGASDRLYYGYRDFEIGPFGVTRIPVDMTHAHCILNLTVRWLNSTVHPSPAEDYIMVLRQVPALYHFTPENVVVDGLDCYAFHPENAPYSFLGDRARINYIPIINPDDEVCHAIKGTVSDKTLFGQFVTFRYRSDSHVLFSIYTSSEMVMKEIDLHRFFQELGIDLDFSLCQEYNLLIEIAGDNTVNVGLVTIDDWEDGGMI
jgi:hypothetical protein